MVKLRCCGGSFCFQGSWREYEEMALRLHSFWVFGIKRLEVRMVRPDSRRLPERRGPRPRTTSTNPHTQLDQQPAAAVAGALRSTLADALFGLEDVHEGPSGVSVPGARALWLDPAAARGPREAFMTGTEFAHLHPSPDWSLHASLPPDLAEEAVARGWAEVHPVARRG